LIDWVKGPALHKHSLALAEIDAIDLQSFAPLMPVAITKPQKQTFRFHLGAGAQQLMK
jgi:hypothetical protein